MEKAVRNFAPELRIDKKSLRYVLWRRSIEASAEFIEQNMQHAQRFDIREDMYRFLLARSNEKGLLLEFGVHNGNSINAIAGMTDRQIHGFDSFEGLPDDGVIPGFSSVGTKWFSGKMSTGGKLPTVRPNVVLHKGWFDEVLPRFFREHDEPAALMHVDCDIYSSTKAVLEAAQASIVPGTIILFDEYLNYEGWQVNEHRALMEFAARTGLKYEFIALTYAGAAAIRVVSIGR
ncbi:MAG: TylF/MycF/NovP-related O-methyltransferase [Hyphomicrobiales bacterium]